MEGCLSASLKEEILSGDNKYSCSGCNSLQDATRYTEIRSLPPVLHFSVMRFVFDFDTMERKKSKSSISFPRTLDMSKFTGSLDARNADAAQLHSTNDSEIYELKGVLLHKGSSAYHGHYEAQIDDQT